MRVNAPFANLRRDMTVCYTALKDLSQETQLLYNEKVEVIKSCSDWSYVEVFEQPYFDKNLGWTGYKGWIQSCDLVNCTDSKKNEVVIVSKWATAFLGNKALKIPFGSFFSIDSRYEDYTIINLPDGSKAKIYNLEISFFLEEQEKFFFQKHAKNFLGDPYFWGGRSPLSCSENKMRSSVDCSGFISLIYRAKGVNIPRNALDQYLISKKITSSELEVGDLIFSAPEPFPNKIDHVMLYLGNDRIVESTMSIGAVQEISCKERFGKEVTKLRVGESLKNGIILYFGRIL